MPLYQSQISPNMSAPGMNRYGYQMPNSGSGSPQFGQSMSAPMPTQGAPGGMNPTQALQMAMRANSIYGQIAGSNAPTAASAAAPSAAPTAAAGGEMAGAAAGEGAAAGAGESGMLAGMGAGSAWMLPVAAAAVMSGVALHEGNSPKTVFGSEGWGGYPFQVGEAIGDGDWKTAGARVLQGGGVGPSAAAGVALEGGDSKDWLRAFTGVVPDVWDYITEGGDTMDLIQMFANPNGNYGYGK